MIEIPIESEGVDKGTRGSGRGGTKIKSPQQLGEDLVSSDRGKRRLGGGGGKKPTKIMAMRINPTPAATRELSLEYMMELTIDVVTTTPPEQKEERATW